MIVTKVRHRVTSLASSIQFITWPQFLGAFAKLQKSTISFVISVSPSARKEQLGSHWKDFHEILYMCIFLNDVLKIQFWLKSDKKTGTSDEDVWLFMIIPLSILLRMRNISHKSCRENENTILCPIIFFRKLCRLWDHVKNYGTAWQDTDDKKIWCLHFACRITKATDTHSDI
jgi:hypothetical protein